MALGIIVKNTAKPSETIGYVSGSAFPAGTVIRADNDNYIIFAMPNKTEYVVTHDKVKNAWILAMGVIDIRESGNQTAAIYGTKYKIELSDGKTAVLTARAGTESYRIEHIIF